MASLSPTPRLLFEIISAGCFSGNDTAGRRIYSIPLTNGAGSASKVSGGRTVLYIHYVQAKHVSVLPVQGGYRGVRVGDVLNILLWIFRERRLIHFLGKAVGGIASLDASSHHNSRLIRTIEYKIKTITNCLIFEFQIKFIQVCKKTFKYVDKFV